MSTPIFEANVLLLIHELELKVQALEIKIALLKAKIDMMEI